MVIVHRVFRQFIVGFSKDEALLLSQKLEMVQVGASINVHCLYDGVEAVLLLTYCDEDEWGDEFIKFSAKNIELFINKGSLDYLNFMLEELINNGGCSTSEFASFPAKNKKEYYICLRRIVFEFDICDFLQSESICHVTSGLKMRDVILSLGKPESINFPKKKDRGLTRVKYGHLHISGYQGIVTEVAIDMEFIDVNKICMSDRFSICFSINSRPPLKSMSDMMKYLERDGISCSLDEDSIHFPGKRIFISYFGDNITRIGVQDALLYGFVFQE